MSDDMPDKNDLRALAHWLAQDCQELVGHIIAKHTANILSELRALVEERKRLRARIAELEAQVRTARAEALEEMADELEVLSGNAKENDYPDHGEGMMDAASELRQKADRLRGKEGA